MMPTLKNRPTGAISVDGIIFCLREAALYIALIQRGKEPYLGQWALPGGFLEGDENAEQGVARELSEETGLDHVFLRQFQTFTDPKRDPRGRVISIAYIGLLGSPQEIKGSGDAKLAKWWQLDDLPPLAFDHQTIIERAIKQLQDYTRAGDAAFRLLPERFTLTELQQCYETVLKIQLDKRNFRKKIGSLDFVFDTGMMTSPKRHRPAALYSFDEQKFRLHIDRIV